MFSACDQSLGGRDGTVPEATLKFARQLTGFRQNQTVLVDDYPMTDVLAVRLYGHN